MSASEHAVTASAEYSSKEEKLNAFSHGVGLCVALFGLILIISKAESLLALSSVSIYGGTLVLMFLASTLYHSLSHTKARHHLKLLDHSAIYLLIAGTYTPLLLVALDGWVSIAGILFIWSMAIAGVSFKLLTHNRYPKIAIATYLAMGWFSVVIAYPLYQAIAAGGLFLLLGGGLFFTFGVFFYKAKHKEYTHAIWHLFVIGGCTCHFLTVYFYVI